jgi:CHAD domain-containing protein
MSAQELLLTALDQRYEKYRAERKRCKDEFSEEAVHDLRIATRRLLALIDLLRAISLAKYPARADSRLQKLRRAFKDQLDSLDDLRDAQVMLSEISEILATLPELVPLQKFLQKREKRLLKAAERDVRAFKTRLILRQIENIRAGLADPAASLDLTACLLSAIDEACIMVSQRKGRVNPTEPASIHRVRVAFKKFRYMLEIVHPILPGFPETQLKDMNNYQTMMGEIQDVEVMLQTLENFAAGRKAYDPQPVRRFYEQRHAELIIAYLEKMNESVSFWRETPEKPFPWEAQEKDHS